MSLARQNSTTSHTMRKQPALAVGEQSAAGVVEVGLVADAREDVGDGAAAGARVERLVRGQQGHARLAREADEALQVALLRAIEVALHLDEDVAATEDPH